MSIVALLVLQKIAPVVAVFFLVWLGFRLLARCSHRSDRRGRYLDWLRNE